MRAAVLKFGATVITVAATVAASVYVTSHLKNSAAPLHPAVLSAGAGGAVSLLGGTVSVGPSVKPTDAQPITSTYAS